MISRVPSLLCARLWLSIFCFVSVHWLFAQQFRITDVETQGNLFRLKYLARTGSYYVLYKGDIEGISTPQKLQLGGIGTNEFSESFSSSGNSHFYMVGQVDQGEPLDLDEDGLDDVYELAKAPLLNPLDRTDAEKDPDGDGLSNREEYENFEDPESPNGTHSNKPVRTGFLDFEVVAKTGQLDVRSRPLDVIDRHPSVNDAGWVAFMGKVRGDDNVIRRNIYAVDPSTGTIRALLNASTSFELPELDTYSPPSQTFSAPMINNEGFVYAWRYMLARVQTGGVITDIPLTYIEAWSSAGNDTPGQRDMPIFQVISGNSDTTSIYGSLFFLNPVTAATLPSPFDPFSLWRNIHGRRGDAFPAVNNRGSVVFGGLSKDGGNYLTTDAALGPNESFRAIGAQPRARIADDNTIVAGLNEAGVKEISLFDYVSPKTRFVLASTSSGWNNLGYSPCISDDGRIIAFYGDLSPAKATEIGLTPGAGVFAAIRDSAAWKLVRLVGVNGNGYLDPGEDDPSGGFAVNGDRGPIASFSIDERCSVNNRGQVVYIAVSTNGAKAAFSTRIDTSVESIISITAPTFAIAVGDPIPQTTSKVTDVSLYDSLNNNAARSLVLWVRGDDAKDYVLRGNDTFVSLSSIDRLVKGTIRINDLLAPGTAAELDLRVENKSTGQVFEQQAIGEDPEEVRAAPIIYDSTEQVLDDDAIESNPKWMSQKIVFVRNRNSENLETTYDFFVLFDDPGQIEVSLIVRPPAGATVTHVAKIEATRAPAVAALLDTIDEHIGNPDAPSGAPPEKVGFFERLLTTKVGAIAFDAMSSHPARLLGGVDGLWSGAKGDYDAVVGLYEALKSPIESARAIGKMFSQIGDVTLDGVATYVERMFANFVNDVDDRIKWAGLSGGPLTQSAYIEGFVIGYGAEQWASGLLTLGFGKAVLTVTKAAKVGAVIGVAVSASKKAVNSVVFRLSRYAPKSKLESALKRLRSEMGAIIPDGINRYAVELYMLSPTIRSKIPIETLNKFDSIITQYARNDLIDETILRAIRVVSWLGGEITEDALIGLARFSESIPKQLGDGTSGFDRLLLYCKDIGGTRDKAGLRGILEQFGDGPGRLFERVGASEYELVGTGLRLGIDSKDGHKIIHVLAHTVDKSRLPYTKASSHDLFGIPRAEVWPTIRDAINNPATVFDVGKNAYLAPVASIGDSGQNTLLIGLNKTKTHITTAFPQ